MNPSEFKCSGCGERWEAEYALKEAPGEFTWRDGQLVQCAHCSSPHFVKLREAYREQLIESLGPKADDIDIDKAAAFFADVAAVFIED